MTCGDFGGDTPSGNDEIAQLSKSFQKVSAYLQQQVKRNQLLTRIMLEINLNLRIEDVYSTIIMWYQRISHLKKT